MHARIMTLPFAFEVRLIPRGKRNHSTFVVRDDVMVHIPQLTTLEAPVALTFEVNEHRHLLPATPAEAVDRTAMRFYDGRLYRSVGGPKPVRAGEFETAMKMPGAWRRQWNATSAPIFPSSSYPHMPANGRDRNVSTPGLPTLEEQLQNLGGARIAGTELARRRDEAVTLLAASLMIVNDEVWTTSHAREPLYQVISTNHNGVELDLSMARNSLAYVSSFRADDFDTAYAFAKAEADRRGILHTDIKIGPNKVEINDAKFLLADNITMTADQALSGVGHLPTEQEMAAWPPAAVPLAMQLKAARSRRIEDPREAAQLLQDLEHLTVLLQGGTDRFSRDLAAQTAMGLMRWQTIEKPRASQLLAQVAAEDEEIAGLDL